MVNWRKILAIIAILIIVAVTGFLLYWFLGRKTDAPVTYKLVLFDEKKAKSTSFSGGNLPSAQLNECGQLFAFNTTATGNFVAPGGSYPWSAFFDYSMKDGSILDILRCGGSIINVRYIVTAAHCVYGKEQQNLKIDKIRLGLASDTNSSNCDPSGDCAQAFWVGIEQIIPHTGYDPLSKVFHNDIALIRVDQDIKFNKFIKPICVRDKTELGGNKYLAGWAKNIASNHLEPKKHVVVLQYPNSKKCEDYFMEHYKVAIADTQICATGDETKEFCIRDSGNALAMLSHDRWYVEGIDSFGKRCGEKAGESMGIYTEVAHYYDWIKSQIRK